MQNRTTITIIATGVVGAGLAAALTSAAGASGGDDTEPPISGDALARASAAALTHTGEGRVTDSEVGDEESYYEIEVTLDDGRQVDVQLDEDFAVVSTEADGTDDAADDEGDS